jgi:hypothetical protein
MRTDLKSIRIDMNRADGCAESEVQNIRRATKPVD